MILTQSLLRLDIQWTVEVFSIYQVCDVVPFQFHRKDNFRHSEQLDGSGCKQAELVTYGTNQTEAESWGGSVGGVDYDWASLGGRDHGGRGV